MTRNQARINLVFNIRDRPFLHLGKPAHIVMCKKDVVFQLLWDQSACRLYLVGRELNIPLILIEFFRIAHGSFFAAGFNISKDLPNRLCCLALVRAGCKGCLLKVFTCHFWTSCQLAKGYASRLLCAIEAKKAKAIKAMPIPPVMSS